MFSVFSVVNSAGSEINTLEEVLGRAGMYLQCKSTAGWSMGFFGVFFWEDYWKAGERFLRRLVMAVAHSLAAESLRCTPSEPDFPGM